MGIGFGSCRSHGDHGAWRQPPLPERLQTCQGKPEVRAPIWNIFLMSWGPGKAKAGGLLSRLGRLPHELVTGKRRRRRPKLEVYSAAGDVSPQAGDQEGPVSAHPLLGPRRWSPGRAGPKAEGTYPISCHPGGLVSCLGPGLPWRWSSRGPQQRVPGALTSSPTLGARC